MNSRRVLYSVPLKESPTTLNFISRINYYANTFPSRCKEGGIKCGCYGWTQLFRYPFQMPYLILIIYSRNKVAGVYFHFVYPERWQSSARGNGINNLFDNKKDVLCWTLCLITKVKWKQQLWYCSIRFTGKSGQIVVSHVIREIYYSVDAILIIYSSVALRSVLLCLLHFQLC